MCRRAAFLTLPAGTVYQQAKIKWVFGPMRIKDDTVADVDWYYWEPSSIESNDSSEWVDRLEAMANSDVRFPIEDAVSRDGLFNDDYFLIFERDDLIKVREEIDKAIAVASPPPHGG